MSQKAFGEPSPASQGLRRIIQDRLVKDVFSPCNGTFFKQFLAPPSILYPFLPHTHTVHFHFKAEWRDWMILILDDETTRIISNALGMYDLMENRITLAEHISKQRAPFRDKAPVYLLSPTEESIDRLIADWTPSKTLKQPLYAENVFLFLIRPLPDDLFAKIKKCKTLTHRLKLFKEINISFLAKQARAFHLDMKSCFSELFLTVRRPCETELLIADKLVTVCATLNEYPYIRYRASSNVCVSIANLLQFKLNEFISKNKDWWYYGDGKHNERGRATFLLLSREDDCLSPLMHEFTYQAMVNDLLNVEDDQITYKTEAFVEGSKELVDKDVLLNDNDELWVEMRASHIADVIQTLSTRIRSIVNSNTGIALGSKSNESKSLSLTQMANAIKALPEYREVMSKLSQHMHIAHQCMDIFNRQNLLDLADLEQTLATGKTEDGKVPKIADILLQLDETLKKIPDSLTRLRLLAIYVLSQRGMRPSDQARLLKSAKLDENHAQALFNLEKLDIPVTQEPASGKISSRIAYVFFDFYCICLLNNGSYSISFQCIQLQ